MFSALQILPHQVSTNLFSVQSGELDYESEREQYFALHAFISAFRLLSLTFEKRASLKQYVLKTTLRQGQGHL